MALNQQLYHAWISYYLMERIHYDFLVKASGGTDSLGIRWSNLKPRTIAYRPIQAGEARKFGFQVYANTRGILTPKQDKEWRGIYSSLVRRGKSPAEAASIAWSIIKRKGGKTKLELLSNRPVLIQIVSRRLERSLRPGRILGNKYIPPAEQKVTILGKRVIVETLVPYASELNQLRPFLPENIDPWITEAERLAKRKMSELR